MGEGGGGHSNSTFYSLKLCFMFNFNLHHNVLCLSFAVVLHSMYSLYSYMQLLKWFSLMKGVVMCNKSLRLESPLKVSKPLEFIGHIQMPSNISFGVYLRKALINNRTWSCWEQDS